MIKSPTPLFTTTFLGLAGCSFMFANGPSARDRRPLPGTYGPVACSTTYVAPTLDVVLTGLEVARTVVAVDNSEADYRGMALSRGADIGFGVALTALAASSAIYGFNVVSECRTVDETRPGPEPLALRYVPDAGSAEVQP